MGIGPEIMAPLTVFGSVVAIVWIVQAYVSRNRRAVLETIRSAIDKGVELSPETIRALGMPRRDRHGDLKWGVIWLAVAAAFMTLGWSISLAEADHEALQVMLGVASFPGFVGIALIIFWAVTLRSRD